MAEIKNTFLKGKMNKDLDSRILPNGEYREARNLSISRSESSTVGEFENILGNISISSLTSIGAPAGTEIIGYHIDENSNTAYLFATDYDSPQSVRAPGSANCYIVSVNLAASNAPAVLVEGSFLNFNKSFRVLGVNLIESLLFFTDNLNQPRKINVNNASIGSTYGPAYTNEDQISVAKYAPYEPILVMERVTTTITGASAGSVTITPASMTGIKVGDIITNNNKIATQNITSLVTVIGIPTATGPVVANTLTLSEAITIDNSTSVDFSRPSMTNQEDIYMSNHSSGAVIINPVPAAVGDTNPLTATYTIEGTTSQVDFLYNGKNGIPKVGDLVSCTNTPSNIPTNTRIATVEVRDDNITNPAPTPIQQIIVTLNKETELFTGDAISISDNPDYDINWQGDSRFLEDKFVRFSYRFKFDDNEYSLMAPFTQPMFIPKQYSQLGGGLLSPTEDMDDAYKSTIVAWFENNINNILLRIPMLESTGSNMKINYHIDEVDILYKESDALAVKVLETLTIASPFTSIAFNDPVHGNKTKYFKDYNYSSNKPYKTLPNNQITRVSDKVPIKALAQEVIGNRIVYGNYLDRHTGPASIDFEATAQNKSVRYDNYTQYPKHQLKQGRTYQVGFVLVDRYGRQSDVILSSNDSNPNVPGSTVFQPYNDLATQTTTPVLDFIGNCLNVKLNSAIQSTYNAALGTPGIYSATNPLGWYSYRIVVKQQEQEYYNVYLPGFVNGYPVIENKERDKSFFTTLIGDNVNKVPRDLVEVGPNERDFSSSERLIIRVNNPLIDNRGAPIYQKDTPWNAQYYPENTDQEVIEISTVRSMEISGIPFEPGIPAGDYGQTSTTTHAGIAVTTLEGSIPWGTTGAAASLYNTDANPFVLRGNQSENIGNPIGAYVTVDDVATGDLLVLSMEPFLSVAETKPVFSLLDIFWETTLSGDLVELNNAINSQYAGVVGSNFTAAEFPESAVPTTQIGNNFSFLDGAGSVITSGIVINSFSIVNEIPTNPGAIFTITPTTPGGSVFQIKTAGSQYFFYDTNVDASPSSGVFTITANVTYNGLTDNIVLPNVSLTNIAPTVTNCSNPSISVGATTIKTFTAVNGSADTSVNANQIVWSLDPSQASYSTINSQFEINSSTGELKPKASYAVVNNTTYTIVVLATDVNGAGLSGSCSISFTVGEQHAPQSICNGWNNTTTAGCSVNSEWRFTASSSTVPTSTGSSSIWTIDYPADIIYNVRNEGPVGSQTGALTQGVMFLKPILTTTCASEDATISFTVEFRSGISSTWGLATCDVGSPAQPAGGGMSANIPLSTAGTNEKQYNFSQIGEYRVWTTNMSGLACSPVCGLNQFKVLYGDATYGTSNCSLGPL